MKHQHCRLQGIKVHCKHLIVPVCCAGLPTVNDYTTMPSTPTWTFVSDYRKKQQQR